MLLNIFFSVLFALFGCNSPTTSSEAPASESHSPVAPGDVPGPSSPSDEDKGEDPQVEKGGVVPASDYQTFFVQSTSDVPACDIGRKNHLYYVSEDSSFIACDGKTWKLVPIGTGTQGAALGSDDNYITKTTQVGPVTSFACSGVANSKIRTDYFTLSSDGKGEPYKSCYTETCTTTITNGVRLQTSTSGTKCVRSVGDQTVCSSGYAQDLSGACSVGVCSSQNVAACATEAQCSTIGKHWWAGGCNNSCESGKITTSRGCELPVDTCTQFQDIADNRCIATVFSEVTGDICGLYADNVVIKAGSRLVTCNSSFTGRVVIEPGATLRVDNNWQLSFKNLYAKGTSANKIVFTKSAGNPAGSWAGIKVSLGSGAEYTARDGWISGNLLEHVDVTGLADQTAAASEIDLSNVVLKNFTVNSPVDVRVSGHVSSSSFTSKTFSSAATGTYRPSVILSSNFNATGNIMFSESLVIWATSNRTIYIYGTSTGKSALYFSDINGSVGCSENAYSFGNKYVTAPTGTCLAQSDNGTGTMTSKKAVHIEGNITHTVGRGAGVLFRGLFFTKSGWINAPSVVWKAVYDVDGNYYDYSTSWSGENPTVAVDAPETYDLRIHSVNSDVNLIGNKSVVLNVGN